MRTYHDPSFAFPAARGREGFTIKADGEFIWHRIAPTDGIMNVPARWHREDGSDGVLVVTDPANGDVSWIVILSVEPGTLMARVES